ncbi:MAG: ribulose-phosphate 3-epimerase [Chloroflexota bacterium]|nr:MAG: ribulose-phosphate 3-epimerase [Chloroflexota bacterium]
MRPISLAPSILAADFTALGEQLKSVEQSGLADLIHIDIMDGQFVPTISFGPVVCAAVRRATSLRLDVHLMVVRPDRFYRELTDLGVDTITVHVEACSHIHRDLDEIRRLGARPGVALNPGTPLTHIDDVIDLVELVLVMTVNPGWGGQAFIPSSMIKVARVARILSDRSSSADVEVDGGIGPANAADIAAAGANILVAGSTVFGHRDGPAAGLAALRGALS